jgi:N6-adenosine-specific RNA methylase IME4
MKFSVILADPPWLYNNVKGNEPSIGGKTYQVMTDTHLQSLRVQDIADDNCSLFLWATMPKLQEALDCIKSWGFKYTTTAFVWVKQNPKGVGIYSGMGHWTNQNAEIVLFAKKGRPKRLNKNVKQILLAPRGRHSAKPKEIHKRIEALIEAPKGYIELFARDPFPGWECIGNELTGNDIGTDIERISKM